MTWTMQPDHFRSTIASDRDPDAVLVRFRHRDHLDVFVKKLVELGFPEPKLLAFGWSDYAFRCVVPREQYKALVVAEVDDITYTNHKDETTKRAGKPLHDAYMAVWSVMNKVQSWPGALRGKAEIVAETPQPKWATSTTHYGSWDWRERKTGQGSLDLWNTSQAERDAARQLDRNLADVDAPEPEGEDTYSDTEPCFCGEPRPEASDFWKSTWRPGSVCAKCGDIEPEDEEPHPLDVQRAPLTGTSATEDDELICVKCRDTIVGVFDRDNDGNPFHLIACPTDPFYAPETK